MKQDRPKRFTRQTVIISLGRRAPKGREHNHESKHHEITPEFHKNKHLVKNTHTAITETSLIIRYIG